MEKEIIAALNWREAVSLFDKEKQIPEDKLRAILESGRLAPSSYGIEPWKFLVIRDGEIRKKIQAAGYGQPRITDSSVLIVLARRTDARESLTDGIVQRTAKARDVSEESLSSLRNELQGLIDSLDDVSLDSWVRAQVYIPLGIMMESASLLGIDCAAMEGFVPDQVDEILGLPVKNLKSTLMLSLGYRAKDNKPRPKARRELTEAIEYIG